MPDTLNIIDFLEPLNIDQLSEDEQYRDGQIGKAISVYESDIPDLTGIDIVLIGCDEERGFAIRKKAGSSPDAIRQEFYKLYYWHQDLKLADIGNVKTGATLQDTYAALKLVITELTQ